MILKTFSRNDFRIQTIILIILAAFLISIQKVHGANEEIIINNDEVTIQNETSTTTDSEDDTEKPINSDEEIISEYVIIEQMDAKHQNGTSWLLPDTTHPLKYHLHIKTNIHRGLLEYVGNCSIEIYVDEDTNEIVLNSYNLTINQIKIWDNTTGNYLENFTFDNSYDFLRIQFNDNAVDKSFENDRKQQPTLFRRSHKINLEILYSSLIFKSHIGFHKLTYLNENNEEVIGANTQLEPNFARTVLPCYDEPRFKAKFTVSITHGKNYTAISNMPQKSKVDEQSGMVTTTFVETPPMSTYILAFAVFNYVGITLESNNVTHRLFVPSHWEASQYLEALSHAAKAVEVFGNFIDIPYALPKLDHVPAREHYGLGMENWGLITYQSKFIQNLKTADSIDRNERYAAENVLYHEIVHQWYGNLLTPESFSYIWLNEGFASYYGFVLRNLIYADKDAFDVFQFRNCRSLYTDDDKMKPMTYYIENVTNTWDTFDSTAYKRAPCVIQMFEHAFGEKTFRKGLSNFLKKHAFSTVTEIDLFDALQNVTDLESRNYHLNVSEIMKSWTHSIFMPLITIERSYDEETRTMITIRQNSLSLLRNETFWIPLNFVTSNQGSFNKTSAVYFMPPTTSEIQIDLRDFDIDLKTNQWLMVNPQHKYLYCTLYDNKNLQLIMNASLENSTLLQRRSLESVLFDYDRAISENPKIEFDAEGLIKVISTLRSEDHSMTWSAANNLVEMLLDRFNNDTIMEEFKGQLRDSVRPIYNLYVNKSASDYSALEQETQGDIEYLYRIIDLPEYLEDCKNLTLNNQIDTELESMVFCGAIKVFNNSDYELYLKSTLEDLISIHFTRAISAFLACTDPNNENQMQLLIKELFFNSNVSDESFQNALVLMGLETLMSSQRIKYSPTLWRELQKIIPNKIPVYTGEASQVCTVISNRAERIPIQFKKEYLNMIENCREYDDEEILDAAIQQLKKIEENPINQNHLYEWLKKQRNNNRGNNLLLNEI